MTVLTGIVLVLHLLGMAAIIGGWFATRKDLVLLPAMLWGARAQIVTGLILVGLVEAAKDTDGAPNHVKLGVKLVVALAVLACAEIANARQRRAAAPVAGAVAVAAAPTLVQAVALLTAVNVCVAVLWT